MKEIVLRLTAAAIVSAAAEALLPPGKLGSAAKRVLALVETAIVAEPIIELLTMAAH